MEYRFRVILLSEAIDFVESLHVKAKEKVLYNVRKSQLINDPELFRKLNDQIWEFRSQYNNSYFRLFAFWDRADSEETLVIATHGYIKKSKKAPLKEIKRAEQLRKLYFQQKQNR